MAKKKKQVKAKEPVRLRFKDLANGNQSIYLDIYRNGKRSYEFPKLYIVPETSEEAKTMNAHALKMANMIKAQRIIELQNGEAGVSNSTVRSKMLLIDWIETCIEHKRKVGSKSSCRQLESVKKQLIDYKGDAITMKEVDKDYCEGFNDFLKHAKTKPSKIGTGKTKSNKKIKSGKPLSPATVATYFNIFAGALNYAVRKDMILFNPITKIEADERVKVPESTREYLTIDEVRALAATPCRYEQIKQAYLFSCLCGLRISDIEKLIWSDIEQDGTQYKAKIVMQKTQKALYQPLSDEAMQWLPERNETKDTDHVFHLPTITTVEAVLKQWSESAGITKHITYHTSRHTFGTLMATLGSDVHTIKDLMGHKDIKTTLGYSKIVNSKKVEAVNRTKGLFDAEQTEEAILPTIEPI